MKYSTGHRKLGESCEEHLQCNGTENAGFCGDNGTCLCNKGFIKLQDVCLQGESKFLRLTLNKYTCDLLRNERKHQ